MTDKLFTTVVAADARYVEQLRWSVMTWKKWRPQIFENPIIIIVDREAQFNVLGKLPPELISQTDFKVVLWPADGFDAPFVNQRDRMLSAFVHVPPREVKTRWWLKVDCDAIASGNPEAWYDPKWFSPDEFQWIMVAPGWGYSKPGHQPGDLDRWANEQPELKNYPPLNIPYNGEKRLGHKRICSWVSFYNTEWTQYAASFCSYPRIPVPSQDGYHWYIAARTQNTARVLKVNMKALGWSNHPNLDNLKERVKLLLNTSETR